MEYLLVILLLIPTLGACVGAFIKPSFAKTWALFVSLLALVVGLVLAIKFDWSRPGTVQFANNVLIGTSLLSLENIGVTFSLGIDSVSLWLIILTVGLMPLALMSSFDSIKEREKEYYAWMLALLTAMLGVFAARDALIFYVFFELTLIPMFFIIGIWGGPDRRRAAGKFFIFTFTGGVFTLAATIYLGLKSQPLSFDLNAIIETAQNLPDKPRFWVLMGLMAGFAVKVPLFPVHTWLPLAHTEAPTAGSVILAGVLLKLGTYGLYRVAFPAGLVGDASYTTTVLHWIGWLCVIGVLYGALVAWVQKDIKKLVAYSSVSHLGFCVLGLAAMNYEGMQGSVLYMINHGLSTGAMFLCIGMVYDRYHTRSINELSGLARKMPVLAFFWVFFVMSSIGLPGLNGFASEFLTVLGAFISQRLGMGFGILAALGVILGAIYMLHMTARVMFGPLKYPGMPASAHGHDAPGHGHDAHAGHGHGDHGHGDAGDLNAREITILVPIAIVCLVVGIFPGKLMDTMKDSVTTVLTKVSTQQSAPMADNVKAQPTAVVSVAR